jgi:hypothetical protein
MVTETVGSKARPPLNATGGGGPDALTILRAHYGRRLAKTFSTATSGVVTARAYDKPLWFAAEPVPVHGGARARVPHGPAGRLLNVRRADRPRQTPLPAQGRLDGHCAARRSVPERIMGQLDARCHHWLAGDQPALPQPARCRLAGTPASRWWPTGSGPNSAVDLPQGKTLRSVRDLRRNDPHARRAMDLLTTHIARGPEGAAGHVTTAERPVFRAADPRTEAAVGIRSKQHGRRSGNER